MAVAHWLLSATLVAATVTVCWLAIVAGAVYRPALLMVPTFGVVARGRVLARVFAGRSWDFSLRPVARLPASFGRHEVSIRRLQIPLKRFKNQRTAGLPSIRATPFRPNNPIQTIHSLSRGAGPDVEVRRDYLEFAPDDDLKYTER